MRAAKGRDLALSVVEWPGGDPVEVEEPLTLDRKLFTAIMRSRWSIPFLRDKLPVFAGLAWGSILTVECRQLAKSEYVAVGPPRFAASRSRGEWQLPVIWRPEAGATKAATLRNAMQWRREHGLHERRAA